MLCLPGAAHIDSGKNIPDQTYHRIVIDGLREERNGTGFLEKLFCLCVCLCVAAAAEKHDRHGVAARTQAVKRLEP